MQKTKKGRGWFGNSEAHARCGRLGGLAKGRNAKKGEKVKKYYCCICGPEIGGRLPTTEESLNHGLWDRCDNCGELTKVLSERYYTGKKGEDGTDQPSKR